MRKVACIGASVVDIQILEFDKFPNQEHRFQVIKEVVWNTGGCALNTSINLSKLRIETDLYSNIGNDAMGDWLLEECKKKNIVTEEVFRSNCNTSFSIITIEESGERNILHYPGSNEELSMQTLDLKQFLKYDVVYIGGVYGLKQFDLEISNFVKKMKLINEDITIILDVIYNKDIVDSSLLDNAFPYIDFFIPNFDEAKKLSNKDNLADIGEYFINKGVKNLIITLAEEGVVIFNKQGSKKIKTIPVKAIDSTGAGDAFSAGFIAGIVNDYNLIDCITLANKVGSISTMSYGASSDLLSWDKINSLNL